METVICPDFGEVELLEWAGVIGGRLIWRTVVR